MINKKKEYCMICGDELKSKEEIELEMCGDCQERENAAGRF